jgi:hypothetical protein
MSVSCWIGLLAHAAGSRRTVRWRR